MGFFDQFEAQRVPRPPKIATLPAIVAEIDRRQRQDDRALTPRRQTVRATGVNTYVDVDDLAEDVPGEVTFYPPRGAAYQVTVRANAVGGIQNGAEFSLTCSGLSTASRGAMTAIAAAGQVGATDVDVATYDVPLVALIGWTYSGAPSPSTVDFRLQFIALPLT